MLNTSIERDFLSKVESYVIGEINLKTLENWITSHWPYLYKIENKKFRELLGEFELALVEMAKGRMTEGELLKELECFIYLISGEY